MEDPISLVHVVTAINMCSEQERLVWKPELVQNHWFKPWFKPLFGGFGQTIGSLDASRDCEACVNVHTESNIGTSGVVHTSQDSGCGRLLQKATAGLAWYQSIWSNLLLDSHAATLPRIQIGWMDGHDVDQGA